MMTFHSIIIIIYLTLEYNMTSLIFKNKSRRKHPFDRPSYIPVRRGTRWSTGPVWPACLPEPLASPGHPGIPALDSQHRFFSLMTRCQFTVKLA